MKHNKGKIIILSAPSGTGKSTIIRELRKQPELNLGFSVSATSRSPRPGENHGKEYYFISEKEFRKRISNDEFVEWEEVYSGTLYGTLKEEVERITLSGRNLIMDIDVKGALNVKKIYPEESISIFILPPSIQVLEKRLSDRGTDSAETIRKRVEKAEYELSFAPDFDFRVVNDSLKEACAEIYDIILNFIKNQP